MKRIFTFIAAAVAAFAMASCSKEQIAELPSSVSDIKLNISVAGIGGDATKATKTEWVEGDQINIWYDLNASQAPDLVIVYDGTSWKADKSVSLSGEKPAESGNIKAMYVKEGMSSFASVSDRSETSGFTNFSFNSQYYKNTARLSLIAHVETAAYSYKEGVLTAELAQWSFANTNNVQVVISNLPEGEWALSCDKFQIRPSMSFYQAGFGVSNTSVGRPSLAYDNEDGKAYMFAYLTKAEDFTFTLRNVVTNEEHSYTCNGINLPVKYNALTSLKIDYKKFLGEDAYIDLSADETANSYIITGAGFYKLNATVCGNGLTVEGLDAPSAIAPDGAKLVWQSVKGMVSDIDLKDGYITFTAAKSAGNAVIAATKDGKIVWSWHIWNPGFEVKALPAVTGYEIMDLNLGATNKGEQVVDIDTFGLLYQWGRKDPFPGSPVLSGTTSTLPIVVYNEEGNPVSISNSSWYNTTNNTLEYSIQNPTVVLSNYSQYSTSRDWLKDGSSIDALWGNPDGEDRDSDTNTYPNKGSKTYFDPCPAGWRVPPVDVFRNATPSGGYDENTASYYVADTNGDGEISVADYNYGWVLYLDKDNDVKTFMPSATRYDGSYAMLMGSMVGLWGNYWSNSPSSGGFAISPLAFQKTANNLTSMSPNAAGSRADAYSVRCIRDRK